MPEFRMPSLGADMDVGTIVEWLVKPGAEVHRGDVIAVVDTAKAAVEVEVWTDGVVDEIVVPVGTEVPVGTVLATLRPLGAAAPSPAVTPPAPVSEPAAQPIAAEPLTVPVPRRETPAPRPPEHVPVASPIVRHLAHQRGIDLTAVNGSGPDGTVTRDDLAGAARPRPHRRVSPYARRLAEELGVDLTTVTGSGRDGTIRAVDVQAAAAAETAPAAPEPVAQPPAVEAPAAPKARAADKQLAMRQAIATLMARSKREVPHYYLSTTVDLHAAITWLHETNAARTINERLIPAALLLKAAALACREVPDVNGFWRDHAFQRSDAIHLGVAVSLRGGGLVAPAIHDADTLSLDALMAALRDVVSRARQGNLRGSEMTDPTITVTNLGDQGVEAVHGVIYVPQVALVGFGKVVDRPWAVDGMLAVRPLVTVTLAADHRASDGHVGGRYLAAIDRLLQKPSEL